MIEIKLPTNGRNWHIALAAAIRNFQPGQVLVVNTESKAKIAKRVAARLDKEIEVKIE